jgi:hypothetical protein
VTPATAPVTAPVTPPKAQPTGRTKVTYNIDAATADAVRDAFWLAHGEYRSLSDWVEDALRRHIEATKAAHGVTELPRRPGPLPTGRPLRY